MVRRNSKHCVPVPEMTGDIMSGLAGTIKTIRFLLAGQELLSVNGGGFFGNFTERSHGM